MGGAAPARWLFQAGAWPGRHVAGAAPPPRQPLVSPAESGRGRAGSVRGAQRRLQRDRVPPIASRPSHPIPLHPSRPTPAGASERHRRGVLREAAVQRGVCAAGPARPACCLSAGPHGAAARGNILGTPLGASLRALGETGLAAAGLGNQCVEPRPSALGGWCHGKKREAPLRERVGIPGSSPWESWLSSPRPCVTALYLLPLRLSGALQGVQGLLPRSWSRCKAPATFRTRNPSHHLCPLSYIASFSRNGFRSPQEVLGTAPQACRAGPAVWHGWVPLQGRAAGSRRVPHGPPGRPQVQSRDSDHWHHGYSVPQPRGKSCPFRKPLTGPVE